MEKQTTGIYLSGHPLDEQGELVKQVGATPIGQVLAAFAPEEEEGMGRAESDLRDGMYITLAGIVSAVRLKTTKNNTTMAYVTLEDRSGSMELLVFQKAMDSAPGAFVEDNALVVYGRISAREDEEPKLVCDRCAVLTPQSAAEWHNKSRSSGWRGASRGPSPRPQVRETKEGAEKEPAGPRLYLRFSGENAPLLEQTKALLRQSPGQTPVVIFYSDTGKRFLARQELWITPGEELIRNLGGLLSPQNVVLR